LPRVKKPIGSLIPGHFTMPAGYAEEKKIVFPKMVSAIEEFSHEKFA
jgi:hypothetical protein